MPEKSVSEFFDSYSSDFNALYGTQKGVVNSLANRIFRRSMKLRFELTVRGCSPIKGKRVLDIGCGPGHYAVHLAKQGAARVLGLDFAPGMLDIARENARRNGVDGHCQFINADFLSHPLDEEFDYTIAVGFMDYIKNPANVIDKVLTITSSNAFFSFPVDGGLLAWQRKQRYKGRCDLFLYSLEQVKELFQNKGQNVEIERISRDFFVTVDV
jgi:2-polyprenyl-3-methyl-5-hydroxy-6-metoxy-1,4-benzoquinol methylase